MGTRPSHCVNPSAIGKAAFKKDGYFFRCGLRPIRRLEPRSGGPVRGLLARFRSARCAKNLLMCCRVFACGLAPLFLMRCRWARPIPVLSPNSRSDIFSNSGSIFITHSSRRGSGYSVYTALGSRRLCSSTSSKRFDSLPIYVKLSIAIWRRPRSPTVRLEHGAPLESAHLASAWYSYSRSTSP